MFFHRRHTSLQKCPCVFLRDLCGKSLPRYILPATSFQLDISGGREGGLQRLHPDEAEGCRGDRFSNKLATQGVQFPKCLDSGISASCLKLGRATTQSELLTKIMSVFHPLDPESTI